MSFSSLNNFVYYNTSVSFSNDINTVYTIQVPIGFIYSSLLADRIEYNGFPKLA